MYFNAHCHLELTALGGTFPPGLSFTEWLSRLIVARRALSDEELRAGVLRGIARMRETGTVAVADIMATDLSVEPLRQAADQDFKVVFFREALQFKIAAATEAILNAAGRQDIFANRSPHILEALSPHSPYTTTGPLLKAALLEATFRGQWMCIHAAETPEEREFLMTGRGPIRDLLDPHLDPAWTPPGVGPIEWLDRHGILGPRTLLAHCNDVSDGELRLIADRGASVVVCPGCHVWFRRGEFPLRRLLESGINVYLGTDSLASNEDLDMEREIQIAMELAPTVGEKRVRELAGGERAEQFFGRMKDEG